MNKRWNAWDMAVLILALAPLLFAWMVYDRLPAQIPSHFGLDGQPDGYSGKFGLIVIFSVLVLGLPFLMKWLPALDPRRENYRKFSRFYELFRLVVTLFLSGMFTATLLYALGYPVNISKVVLTGVGLLWMVIGNYLGQVRSNWFFGIKLPWTLENEEVWRRTHRLSGPLWMGAGILLVLSVFLPSSVTLWTVSLSVLVILLVPPVYAYYLFRKLGGAS